MAPLSPAALVNLAIYVSFSCFCLLEVRARRRFRAALDASEGLAGGGGAGVPAELLDEMDAFPGRILGATLLRIAWLGFELSGLWQDSFYGCRDKHLVVETLGRLGQLAYFSSFLGVLTVWWELVRTDDLFFPASTTGVATAAGTGAVVASAQGSHLFAVQSALERSTARRGPAAATTALASEETLMATQALESRTCCSPTVIQVLFNFWVWVGALGLFLFKYESCSNSTFVSDAQTVCIALASGVLGIMFVAVGTRLYRKLGVRDVTSRKRLRRRVAGVTVVCFLSFGVLRCGLFLVRPITGYYFKGLLGDVLYPWFFYTVPELVPSFVMLWFTRRNSILAPEAELAAAREQVRMMVTERTALLGGGGPLPPA